MKTGLVLTAFKRPEFLKEATDALLECRRIEGVPLYIGLDWSEDVEPRKICAEFASKWARKSNAPMIFNNRGYRLGCPVNVVESINDAFKRLDLDAMIHVEDDVLVSRDFVGFMRDLLVMFSGIPNVWTVDGDHEHNHLNGEGDYSTLLAHAHFLTMGWGTWRRNWNVFYKYWLVNGYYPRKTWGWDYVMEDCRIVNNGIRVFPRMSRVTHIGWYGTNISKNHGDPNNCLRAADNWEPDHPDIEKYDDYHIRYGVLEEARKGLEGQSPKGYDKVFSTSNRCM